MTMRLMFAMAVVALSTGLPTSATEYRSADAPVARGRELFATCVRCHGAAGTGDAETSIPAIAGQHMTVIAKQLDDFRYLRRWNAEMERLHSDHELRNSADVDDVAAFVSKLEFQSTTATATGAGEHVASGALVYTRRCLHCHGVDATGDARSATPRLAGQHYGYLMRQLDDAIHGRRMSLSGAHVRLLEPLDRHTLEGVADFLSRQRIAK